MLMIKSQTLVSTFNVTNMWFQKSYKTASNKNRNNITKQEEHEYLFLIKYQYFLEA
jgi:hypothetical protein